MRTITGLVPAGTLDGTELLEIVQAGKTRKTTTQAIANRGGVSGVASIVAGSGISVNSADPANPIISATSPGGGVALESYQNSAMSAAVMAYVFRDQSNNIYRVYEPIRNNDVSRSVWDYADSIDKVAFDNSNWVGNVFRDFKLIGISSDAIVKNNDLINNVINGGSKTTLQLLGNVMKGDFGEDTPNDAEVFITGDNVIIRDNNMTYGSYLDSLGDNTLVKGNAIDSYVSIEFDGKTGCELLRNPFLPYSGMKFHADSLQINNNFFSTYSWLDASSNVNQCVINGGATLTAVNSATGVMIGTDANVDNTGGNMLDCEFGAGVTYISAAPLSNQKFLNISGVNYQLGVTDVDGVLTQTLVAV